MDHILIFLSTLYIIPIRMFILSFLVGLAAYSYRNPKGLKGVPYLKSCFLFGLKAGFLGVTSSLLFAFIRALAVYLGRLMLGRK